MNNFRILEMKRNQVDKKRLKLRWQLDKILKKLDNNPSEKEVVILGAVIKAIENDFKELYKWSDKLNNSYEYDPVKKETVWYMENLMIDIDEEDKVEYDEISFRVGDLIV